MTLGITHEFYSSVIVELSFVPRLMLPGRAPDTRFGANAQTGQRLQGMDHEAYAELAQSVLTELVDDSGELTHAEDVAAATWRAVTDPASPMRIPAGADAQAMADAA